MGYSFGDRTPQAKKKKNDKLGKVSAPSMTDKGVHTHE